MFQSLWSERRMSLFDMQNVEKSQKMISKVYETPGLKTCPIEATFRIIGKRWTVLILREMFRGVTQFNRLHENIEGVTPRMLSLRLRELERNKIIKRKIISDRPVRVEYKMTELGQKLGPLLLLAASFSMRWLPNVVFKDGKSRDPLELAARS
jgi:DNA-binding HxlR family transcriptional regulator